MIKAFNKTIAAILKNPFVLLPAIIVGLVLGFVFNSLFFSVFELFYDFGIQNKGIALEFFKMVVVFSKFYSVQILSFVGIVLICATLISMLLFFYSKYAMHFGEKDAFSQALKYMFSNIPRAFGFVLFGFIFCFFTALVFLGLSFLFSLHSIMPLLFFSALFISAIASFGRSKSMSSTGLLAILVLIFFALPLAGETVFAGLLLGLLAVLVFFIALKLFVFAVPALTLEEEGIRTGLSKSWAFSSKKMFETILGLFIVWLVNAIILSIGLTVLGSVVGERLSLLVTMFFNSLAFVFGFFFFAFYYFDNHNVISKSPTKKRKTKPKKKKK